MPGGSLYLLLHADTFGSGQIQTDDEEARHSVLRDNRTESTGCRECKALLAIDSELELVHELVPATANRGTVSGDAATRAGALEALEEYTWVHLACHAKQDLTQPYNSHFVMRDEHLTLLDIMEKDIPHAEFAFLSACHTAVGDKETPDGVIHLAAGLQFSGFKSVVGMLWEVDDSVAQHVVKAFYENMFKDSTEAVSWTVRKRPGHSTVLHTP